jgi:hypothetical protein
MAGQIAGMIARETAKVQGNCCGSLMLSVIARILALRENGNKKINRVH